MPLLQQITEQGFAIVPQVLNAAECDALADHAVAGPTASRGTRRLLQLAWCRTLVGRLRQHPALSGILAPYPVAVQCTYFEKSVARNWLVPLHQDLSIPVARRTEDCSLGPWSEKEGVLFVQPPVACLQQLIAVRLHIDACTVNDGPLRVIAGTHTLGKLDAQTVAVTRHEQPEQVCTAAQGSAMLMRPLLLHASSKSTGTGQRRVLHILFGPSVLPMGLEWQDAV
ncbi:MAG: phytanoyl-CoA dioxygenase family protein [Rhodoferax sp.]